MPRYTPAREGVQAIAVRPRHRGNHRCAGPGAGQGRCAADERWVARARRSRLPVMTTALVVGVGAVGARAARQLIDTPGIDRVFVSDRDGALAAEVADALGPDTT